MCVGGFIRSCEPPAGILNGDAKALPRDASLREGLYNGGIQVRVCGRVSLRSQLDREGVGKRRPCMWKEILAKIHNQGSLMQNASSPPEDRSWISLLRARELRCCFQATWLSRTMLWTCAICKAFHFSPKADPGKRMYVGLRMVPLPTKLIGIIQAKHARSM